MSNTQTLSTADANTAVVSNALQIAVGVIEKVAGNEISNTLGGRVADSNIISELCAAKLQTSLSKQTGGV